MRFRSAMGLCALLLASGCHEDHNAASAPAAVTVRVAKVERRDLADAVELAGTLEPPPGRSVKLGALVAGRLAEILVAEGDRVAAGALVARLEATPLRDAVSQAEAALRQAQAQKDNAVGRRERAEKLLAAGVAARQEVDDARNQEVASESAVRNAEAALSTAKNQLARSELHAPFAGTVSHLYAAAGEPVDGTGKPIVEIADTSILELRASVSPAPLARLAQGQRAELHVEGASERAGEVFAVAPVIDPATGAGTVRIRVENRDGILKGGSPARARVVLAARPGALSVPREALVPRTQGGAAAGGEGEGYAVERVEGGLAKRVPVETGVADRGFVEIRGGLAEGDQVIVQGAYALPDGTPVRAGSGEDAGQAPQESR